MATPQPYDFQHANWDSESTDSAKLTKLAQHIAEVGNVAGDFQKGGARMRIDATYVSRLFAARAELIAAGATVTTDDSTANVTNLKRRFGIKRFVRGSSA